MSKKSKYAADFGKPENQTGSSIAENENTFYFAKENYKFMLIGLALIIAGFLLMLGSDANTVNGKYDPASWNDEIFSFRRIRLAPLLVIAGFAVEAYAILKRNNNNK